MINKFLYYLLFGIWYAFAKLPACVHYFNAWWLSALVYHVVRYRRGVVRKNITASFPQLGRDEIIRIEKRFYRHFCDILVESVMYLGMSREEVMRRMRFVNFEVMDNELAQGHDVGLYMGHYANWEYISSMMQWAKTDCHLLQLYHPLENPVFNRIISYTRQRFGNINVPVNESLRHIVRYRRTGKPVAVGFIADQVPMWNNIHYWTNFLNHPDTPVFTGPERLIRKLDMKAYYLEVRQLRRGYYEAEFKLLCDNPKEHDEFWLTEQYNRVLEDNIKQDPALWLWSHNRWKRTKEEWEKMGLH